MQIWDDSFVKNVRARQEIPGLCLLTIFSMGGMMGSENMHLEKDFTLLLWLSISINYTLFIPQYTSICIDIFAVMVKYIYQLHFIHTAVYINMY